MSVLDSVDCNRCRNNVSICVLRCMSLLSSLQWGCLYKISWLAFPSGSGYFLFPHKMCVVFIYTVFPVPLGEIHLGDVSEAHRKWPQTLWPRGIMMIRGLGTWQRQNLIGLMINTKPTNGKTWCLVVIMTPFWWQLRNKNTNGKSNSRIGY